MYADEVYEAVKQEAEGLDAIYEDYIIRMVGNMGLRSLKENGHIEACGVVNGRQLYVIVDKK